MSVMKPCPAAFSCRSPRDIVLCSALQGLLGTPYVLTAVTDTFKHLQADDDVTDSTVEVCLWCFQRLKLLPTLEAILFGTIWKSQSALSVPNVHLLRRVPRLAVLAFS